METVSIQLSDGTMTPVCLFRADAAGCGRPVIIVVPGLGIPGVYFEPLAYALVERGCGVAVSELRGQGDSYPRPSKESAFGYHALAAEDLPAIVAVARERLGDGQAAPYLLGHSLGGQVAALYASRPEARLAGLILIAAGTPYFRGYRGKRRAGMLVAAAAMASIATVVGYWPGGRWDIGGFGPQSRVLITDWARLARRGRFVPAGADVDYEQRLAQVRLPVLSIIIAGDNRSPAGPAAHLVDKLSAARVTRWTQPRALGHNRWIRTPDSTVDRIGEWLREITS